MASRPATHSDSVWFEHLSSRPKPLLRLFGFPYAGGNPQVFRNWQRHLPPEVDLCLAHLPGHGRKFGHQPFTRMSPLIDALARQIRSELQEPFAFYGHSMGATISFELARELQRRYKTGPMHLFVSGRRAPHVPDADPPTFSLPHDEFVAELRRLNGTPQELLENPETTELFLPIVRADFEVIETYEYHPGERLACPITVYGGLQDQDVPIENLRAWQEHTSGAFKIRMFPGDHFFIHGSSAQFLESLRGDVLSALQGLTSKT
jgi:medium-chain acyl-[acyl-carrier-protein] hydrolase